MADQTTDAEDEKILRVGSGSPAPALASAISHAIYAKQSVLLRAIGAGAVNQAAKAIAIAGGFVGARGYTLSVRIGFTTLDMEDKTGVTAMTFKVIAG